MTQSVENTLSNWGIDNARQKMSLIEEFFAECFETDFVVPPHADRLTRTLTYQFLRDDTAIHDVIFADGFLEKPVGRYKKLLDKWNLVETVSNRIERGVPNRTTVKANGIE